MKAQKSKRYDDDLKHRPLKSKKAKRHGLKQRLHEVRSLKDIDEYQFEDDFYYE